MQAVARLAEYNVGMLDNWVLIGTVTISVLCGYALGVFTTKYMNED